MVVRENVPLSPFTTLGVGGSARYFADAYTEIDVCEAVRFAQSRGLPLFVLGGGSNLLVADTGFDGLVLKVSLRGITSMAKGNEVTFRAAAGEDWDAFAAHSVEQNCAGVECLSGIPGTLGGTPVQNVGAYGQDVSESITAVEVLQISSLERQTLSNRDCSFGYRSSIFNTTQRGRYIILHVSFVLLHGGQPAIRYVDLQKAFANAAERPTLSQVRNAVRDLRRTKAMLLVPGDEDARSAGSFFKNPVVTHQQFDDLEAGLRSRGETLPNYPAGQGFRKISAAWLVEHAGFAKGYKRGAAGISRRHALAIVNHGGATAADIVDLKDEIQSRVLAEFGIELQAEPEFLGF